MPTLRDIKRRISSVKSTQQITRAMKLVAAAKLRRAQERIEHARPYASTMAGVLGDLTRQREGMTHPLLTHPEERAARRLLVVISGDRGLCGAFNSNIVRRSLELLRASHAEQVALALVVVGRKVRDFYRRRAGQAEIRAEHVNILERLTYAQAAGIAQGLMQPYLDGEVDEVVLLYTEFRSMASQRVVVERLLPLEPPRAGEGDAEEAEEYLFEPSPEAVLERLLPRHVEVQVFRALLESIAAEYGARMTAMENATRNAAEMIELLTVQFNKARQERITKELLEIVGGAEALRHASE